jgi:hypothetical protein
MRSDPKKKSSFRNVFRWIRRNEFRLVAFVAILVCSVIGFQAGMLFGKEHRADPLVVENIREDCPIAVSNSQSIESVAGAETVSEGDVANDGENCAFVGSKNSNKYHSPGCHWAKQIKPENIRCFASEQEAQAVGYVAGCIQ